MAYPRYASLGVAFIHSFKKISGDGVEDPKAMLDVDALLKTTHQLIGPGKGVAGADEGR